MTNNTIRKENLFTLRTNILLLHLESEDLNIHWETLLIPFLLPEQKLSTIKSTFPLSHQLN